MLSKQKMQMIHATGAAAHQASLEDNKPLTKFHELVFAKLNGEDYPGQRDTSNE